MSDDLEVTQTAVIWSTHYRSEGAWSLHLLDRDGESSDVLSMWENGPTPPPLIDRYDALASLGYAVAEGGGEAWAWREATSDEGNSYWVGTTDVRRLVVADLEQLNL